MDSDHTGTANAKTIAYAIAAPECANPNCVNVFEVRVTDMHAWIVDCGANRHCAPSASVLTKITQQQTNMKVQVANGDMVPVECIGEVQFCVKSATGIHVGKLTNVLVIPGFVHCLFSCEYAYRHDGIETHLNNERYLRLHNGAKVCMQPGTGRYQVVLTPMHGGGEDLKRNLEDASTFEAISSMDDDELIHARLGHFSISRIRAAIGKTTGMDLGPYQGHENCELCARGGIRNQRFSKQAKTTSVYTFFGQCVATDLAGPFPTSTPNGFEYAINFVDKYSKHIAVYYLKTAHSAASKAAMIQYISDHKNYLKEGKVHEWFTDNGKEFRSNDLDEFCTEFLIRRGYSVPYKSNTNPLAERA